MKFIFWNICDKDDTGIGSAIKDLVKEQNPDVLLLAETNVSDKYIFDECGLEFLVQRSIYILSRMWF
jgi:hypothetical protein